MITHDFLVKFDGIIGSNVPKWKIMKIKIVQTEQAYKPQGRKDNNKFW